MSSTDKKREQRKSHVRVLYVGLGNVLYVCVWLSLYTRTHRMHTQRERERENGTQRATERQRYTKRDVGEYRKIRRHTHTHTHIHRVHITHNTRKRQLTHRWQRG